MDELKKHIYDEVQYLLKGMALKHYLIVLKGMRKMELFIIGKD